MLIRKAHVYRLHPTSEQAETLGRWVGAVRATYNVALEQRRDFWKPGRTFNLATQCREVTALRAEFDWLRDVPVNPLHQAIRDLQRAYETWWAALRTWKALPPVIKAQTPRPGHPTPRKRGLNDAMRFPKPEDFAFRRLSRRLGEVRLPKLGWVRLRWDRSIPGTVKNITVVRRSGIWTVAAQYEREVEEPSPSTLPPVGIDRGVTVFAALSTGEMIAPANAGKKTRRALVRAQRKLARKRKGSANRRKAASRVAKLQARIARTRKDFCHKVSTTIAKNHGTVVLEALKVRNMVRSAKGTAEKPGRNVRAKAGLNRSILDQGWGMFREMLAYKLAERGARLIGVPPENTSRTCAICGTVDAASRQAQRFCCTACGHTNHADVNAALVILERARDTRSLPVEAARKRADEAGTLRRVA